jgi:protein associated with RNAse G/E
MRSFILLHRDSEFNIIINCVSRLRIADWSGQGRDLYFGPCLYEEDREMPQITEDEFNQHLKKYEFNIDIKQFLDDNE